MGEVELKEIGIDASFLFAKSDLKEQVTELEKVIGALPQVAVPPQHHVFGGIYTRTGLIPAGQRFVGAIHTKDHINIVCGDVSILTEEGMVRLTGYNVLPTKAGSKRVGRTHADTMWTTIIHTDLTDIEAIEDEICEDSSILQTRTGIIKKEDQICY